MVNKSSIMIDIDDPRSDRIAEAISNKTSKKVLSLLSEGEMSGSEIAEKLGVPLNTISYNLKKLNEAGLVEKSKKVFWSSRGKRMELYKLSNKKIVISPRKMVRGVVPALIVTALIALIIALSGFGHVGQQKFVDDVLVRETGGGEIVVQEDYGVGVDSSSEVAGGSGVDSELAALPPSDISGTEVVVSSGSGGVRVGIYDDINGASELWAWYFIGALTALLILVLWNMTKSERGSD